MTTTTTKSDMPGVIVADALYTLQEVQQRLRLGAAAMRQARRQGLILRKIGRRKYLLGRDILAWLESTAD